ncbi:MAG: hypothetical protein ACK55Z_31875, partial [bacterium]
TLTMVGLRMLWPRFASVFTFVPQRQPPCRSQPQKLVTLNFLSPTRSWERFALPIAPCRKSVSKGSKRNKYFSRGNSLAPSNIGQRSAQARPAEKVRKGGGVGERCAGAARGQFGGREKKG